MGMEITIPLEEYKQLVTTESKYELLIDSLLDNAELSCDQLYITLIKLETILMTFEPEGYKNAVEWLKKKGEKDG